MKRTFKGLVAICLLFSVMFCFVACDNKPTMYTYTFESYGGGQFPAEKYEAGTTVNYLPTPFRYGFSFLGWAIDENYSELVEVGDTASADYKLYAKYVINENHFSGDGRSFTWTGETINQVVQFPAKETYYILIKDTSGSYNFSNIEFLATDGSLFVCTAVRMVNNRARILNNGSLEVNKWTSASQMGTTGYYVLEVDVSAIGSAYLKIS